MQITRLPFESISQLSARDKAYQSEDPALRPFYKYPVNLNAFAEVIENRKKQPVDRILLVDTLHKQYAPFSITNAVRENIELLRSEDTFTIVTAHQPSLFTGPLYFIYKIASTINLCKQLGETYPSKKFVPVFIIGGEDHDFEEINHLHLFGKELIWENQESGSVGRMQTASLADVLEQLYEILGDSPNAGELKDLLDKSFKTFPSYGQATAAFVLSLFGKFGLVVLNMDDAGLKRAYLPIIKEEVLHQVSKPLVDESKLALEKAGFSGQAFAREVNFFYLDAGLRNRIVEEADGSFSVLGTDKRFAREAFIREMEEHPERFSPNVIMRPLYQELILPNLAYIGGGGELAYWLERKKQFEFFGLPFPMLIRRNSVLWIDKGSQSKRLSLGMEVTDLFEEVETYIKKYVKGQSDEPLSIQSEKNELVALFDSVRTKASAIDKSLEGAVEAEKARQLKSMDNLEQRILRAEKQKHEIAIQQIRNLSDKLFPGRGLQERHDNFMGIYLKHGDAMLDLLVEQLDPMDKDFLILEDQ
ncbi:MAG: bacillithiol biosynthesis cysteine-adding enzyme BshC [Saprospiraceae bacterium]|nr:bacillithiol biosynthesis cysteine-adding enzyme BshC [Saprospiraceae bacterium]